MDTSNFKEVFESPKVKTLTAQVAALELEVARLRNALENHSGNYKLTKDECRKMDALLSTPFSPTALNKMIEKVEKITIERCIGRVQAFHYLSANFKALEEELQSLPTGQVKLEELL